MFDHIPYFGPSLADRVMGEITPSPFLMNGWVCCKMNANRWKLLTFLDSGGVMQIQCHETKIETNDGVSLYVSKKILERPKAVMVIVHGLCEHSGRYDEVTASFNSRGFSVYRFDNRGHGKSGGDRGYVRDFNELIEDASQIVEMAKTQNQRLPLFMLGHSMGGFIAAAYDIRHPHRLTGQILSGAATAVSPLLSGLEGVDFSANARDPIPNALSAQISRDPNIVDAYVRDPLNLKEFTTWLMSEVLIRGARWLMDQTPSYTSPCLILHGGGDQIVPPEQSKQFFERIGSRDKTLKIYDGLYHEILNEPEKETVIEDISAWMEARLSS
jgi:alpha-beta hydrolase superfamily lysophospholipase